MPYKIAPSVLSADFLNLQRDIEMMNTSEADWIHVDVMDGVFVPNISFGFSIIKQIKKVSTKPLDVHLMIVQPEKYIKEFKAAGADILTVQYEACTHLHRTICQIKEEGMQAAVALNPHTPVHLLRDIITDLDMVLLMTVNPGFGGQKFIEHGMIKLRELKDLIEERHSKTIIEIDGGVSLENAPLLLRKGADVLVAGNAVFSTPDPIETIRLFKNIDLATAHGPAPH
jgi:ribulose-phosphate 3-epimerase